MTLEQYRKDSIYCTYKEVYLMATKAVNIRLEEEKIREIRKVADIFHMTLTDVINEALNEYLPKMQRDPYYRLSLCEEASAEESAEILKELKGMSDEDLEIVSRKKF